MSLPRTVADVIRDHVTLELECIDRLYLNVYQPSLQRERDVFRFLRDHRGQGAVSSRCFQTMTQTFVQAIDAFAQQNHIPVIAFAKHQRKEEVAASYRAAFQGSEGVLFIGKAQEKVTTFPRRAAAMLRLVRPIPGWCAPPPW